jgi:hypothetical protein
MSEGTRTYSWQGDSAAEATEDGPISRWSRRKLQARRGVLEPEPVEPLAPAAGPGGADADAEEPAVRIDPRTGKPFDELTDEDMPPLESLDHTSDLSVFLARNISASLRMKALATVFASSQYNKICLCAEYADDYTNFTPLGDVVPHDLKSALAREAMRLRDRLLALGDEISADEAEARVAAETGWARSPPAADIDVAEAASDPDAPREQQQG